MSFNIKYMCIQEMEVWHYFVFVELCLNFLHKVLKIVWYFIPDAGRKYDFCQHKPAFEIEIEHISYY